jgi:hypothetical protein
MEIRSTVSDAKPLKATVIVPYGVVTGLSGADVFGNSVISAGVSGSEGPVDSPGAVVEGVVGNNVVRSESTGCPQLIKIKLAISNRVNERICSLFIEILSYHAPDIFTGWFR